MPYRRYSAKRVYVTLTGQLSLLTHSHSSRPLVMRASPTVVVPVPSLTPTPYSAPSQRSPHVCPIHDKYNFVGDYVKPIEININYGIE